MDWTPLLVAVVGAAITGVFALLIALLVWVLNRLWKVNDGIASLREGQVRLESGQASLREGQARLESGQQEIIRRLERLESPHPRWPRTDAAPAPPSGSGIAAEFADSCRWRRGTVPRLCCPTTERTFVGRTAMSYQDFLTWVDRMDEPLPYSSRTMYVFLDAVARTLAENDLILPENRRSAAILQGVAKNAATISDQLTQLPNKQELMTLCSVLGERAVMYQHQHLQNIGKPLPMCGLPDPCPYHP